MDRDQDDSRAVMIGDIQIRDRHHRVIAPESCLGHVWGGVRSDNVAARTLFLEYIGTVLTL